MLPTHPQRSARPRLIARTAAQRFALGFLLASAHAAADLPDAPPPPPATIPLHLLNEAEASKSGVYLSDIVRLAPGQEVPRLRISPAPSIATPRTLTRAQILDALRAAPKALPAFSLAGAERVLIKRRSRLLDPEELRSLLAQSLQAEQVRERGTLEVRLARSLPPLTVPDDPVTLDIRDVPASGLASQLTLRFDLRCGDEIVASGQAPLQLRLLREVYVAGGPVLRGTSLADADLVKEPRDVLALRDAIPQMPANPALFELAEPLSAGTVLTPRSLRPRPLVRRGKVLDATVLDGGLSITTRVEALEDGVAGQSIRVRNLTSKREFRGKVQNEETLLVL